MATITEIREQYPQYSDMTDTALADALYSKFYSDIPREQFNAKVGLKPATVSDEDMSIAAINLNQPRPDNLKARGSVLPIGRDEQGNLTAAMPEIVAGPMRTMEDLATGRRTPDQITGKEIFDLGMLFGGSAAGGPAGTGAGIARAATERSAAEAAAPVAREAVAAAPAASAAPVARAAAPESRPATTAEFKDAAQAFYRTVDESGVTFSGKALKPVVEEIVTAARKAGMDEILTPDSVRALTRLSEAVKQPVPFSEFDTLGQIVGIAKGAARPKDRMIAEQIGERLDKFVENLSAKDVLSGDAKMVSEFLPKAKDLWMRYRKLELVDGMVEKALTSAPNFSASGLENALRTQFRTLARNDKELRRFEPQERDAIKRIARGGFKENTARNVGRFAPTGPVSATLGIGSMTAAATSLLGSPIAGFAVGAAGAGVAYASRRLATALTQRNVAALQTLIREGGDSLLAQQALDRGQRILSLLAQADARASASSAATNRRK